MSELCIFNLTEYDCDSFNEYNRLAKKLVSYSLKNNLAVFFNYEGHVCDIIKDRNMKHYFLLSDSFIYRNCDFLSLDYECIQQINTMEKFACKYYFFEDIVKILLNNNVKKIEIYISEEFDTADDNFEEKMSSSCTIIQDLFENVFRLDYDGHYFKSTKYVIKK